MKLKRLSADDFDRLAASTRLGDRARDMARAVLVDGRSQVDVAAEFGMTKQRVHLAIATMERAYSQTSTPGRGWIGVDLNLPEPLALELTGLIDCLQKCENDALRDKALARAVRGIAEARQSIDGGEG